MMRPSMNGPRSLMTSSVSRPFARLVTRTLVPSGRVLCAAEMPNMSYVSPVAVFLPWKSGPYQEAVPTSS